ncbi:HAD family phosphatase [Candidatus Saccharibacteria bacterium]|nr:HAD family phosphatase [Candidatus Saccharibacteria bacterium]
MGRSKINIQAIVFDCFGVLVTETSLAFARTYLSGNQNHLQQFEDAKRASDLGYISTEELCKTASELSGLSEAEVFKILEQGSSLDESMLGLVRQLKKRSSCKIGMLSNITPNRLDDFFTAEEKQLFDALTLSYETGYVKPDERAFQVALDELGVMAEETIFIDDQLRNIDVAEKLGFQTVHFADQPALEAELKQYGILPL